MALTSALNTALTGLRATQAGLEVTAGNVANADTVGYARRTLALTSATDRDRSAGVIIGQVQRHLDLQVQTQLRANSALGENAAIKARYAERLDMLFGQPGAASSLDALYAGLTGAMESLVATPDSITARIGVIDAAATFAGQLNSLSASVQAMREEAETGIADAVDVANEALANIHRLNAQIQAQSAGGAPSAGLLDERDKYVATLASIMDIRVGTGTANAITVFTASGLTLLDGNPGTLAFDGLGGVNAEDEWSADPAERSVGTLTITHGGSTIDLFAADALRSGSIAAYRELRDTILVEAQRQLDSIAGQLALALANDTVEGTPVNAFGGDGFELDLAGLQAGNAVTLDYREMPAGTERRVSFIRVDDPATLPLADDVTADPDDTVFGIDFSGGFGSVVAQIQAALGGSFTVSNPSGSVLSIVDDGVGGAIDIDRLSAGVSATGLADGSPGLAFFVTAGDPFTGSLDGTGQLTGFAGRIQVNPALVADPARLTIYDTGVASGDPTRPQALMERLADVTFAFSAETGIGSTGHPFTGTLGDFVGQVLAHRGASAERAVARNEAQAIVVASLQQRFDAAAKVSIDDEMAHLVALQTAYAANARIMSAIKEMLDMLTNI